MTRTRIVRVTSGPARDDVIVELYRELHDGCAHLEVLLEGTRSRLNLVVPDPMVPGIVAILSAAEAQHTQPVEEIDERDPRSS